MPIDNPQVGETWRCANTPVVCVRVHQVEDEMVSYVGVGRPFQGRNPVATFLDHYFYDANPVGTTQRG